jgi:hypothetical protein
LDNRGFFKKPYNPLVKNPQVPPLRNTDDQRIGTKQWPTRTACSRDVYSRDHVRMERITGGKSHWKFSKNKS